MEVLNRHAPLKIKYLRANDGPFMTKVLRKAIMLRSKMRNRLNKVRSVTNSDAYKKQRNLCTSLLRNSKKKYYGNLNPKIVTDNKKFWKNIKPLFSDKSIISKSVTLFESYNIYDNDETVSNIFSNYFSNIVDTLNIDSTWYEGD